MRRVLSRRRAQDLTEMIILVGIVGIGVVFIAELFPQLLTNLYNNARTIVAAPF